MAHAYPTLKEAKSALHRMGDMISDQGTPKDFGPLVYAFTGAGNVAQVIIIKEKKYILILILFMRFWGI